MGELCYKCDRSTLDVSNSKIFTQLLLGHLEKKMREHVSRQKKTTTGFSIPSLKHPTRGFGLESSTISRQAVPKIQPLDKPVTHDISRIPLRSQAKLSISQPGDIYEQEADSVAQQVMQRMAEPVNRQSIQQEALPEDEEELQMKPLDISTLQLEAFPEDEEELQMKPMVQPQVDTGMDAAPDIEASINQARGSGVAIADNIREPMEMAFGADFSRVKVHTDGQSDQLNRSIQARAFTTGQDVFFRQGEYNPGSRDGQQLLAHELTHVVQQNGDIQRYSSHEQSSLQRELNITSYLVQKTPIGGPQHNYTANNSSNTFISDHLAQTEAQAETATLNRANNGRGTTNTVLMETDANVKALVLGADYDAAELLGGPIWKVPINCNYIIIRAAHGANNNIIRERGSVQNGRVWVKVYFNEQGRTVSITGVWGQ
ncbi:DUF4157 domain-containing protein [Nostoc sp. DedQUE02]|uniref:eCIS core domain-containing protein n=1 Tax=Nostoc sp. DedQUE02 TaxID=3075388 RepID=UPI00391B1243